jgi:hypothetical protein
VPGKAPLGPRKKNEGSKLERALRLFSQIVGTVIAGIDVSLEKSGPNEARGTLTGSHAGFRFEAAFILDIDEGGMNSATYRVPHARVQSPRRLPFEEEAFRDEVVTTFKSDNTHASLGDFASDRVFVQWDDSYPVLEPVLIQRLRDGLDALEEVRTRHTQRWGKQHRIRF